MAVSVPLDLLEKAEYKMIVDRAISTGLSLGESLIAATKKVYRDLKPKDLGLTGDEWKFSVTAGENKIVDYKVPDDTLIVIYGVFNLSEAPVVTELLFGDASKTTDDFYIEDMYLYEHPVKIFRKLIVAQPNSNIVIRAVAKADNANEKLGFLGIVIERAGKTISG